MENLVYILPEVLKAFSGENDTLIHQVWKECKVPISWCNTVLIPVPKKGNLK